MIKKTYVVGSSEDEAWLRFRAKLTHADLGEASEMADHLHYSDMCDPQCEYDVYAVVTEIEKTQIPRGRHYKLPTVANGESWKNVGCACGNDWPCPEAGENLE